MSHPQSITFELYYLSYRQLLYKNSLLGYYHIGNNSYFCTFWLIKLLLLQHCMYRQNTNNTVVFKYIPHDFFAGYNIPYAFCN